MNDRSSATPAALSLASISRAALPTLALLLFLLSPFRSPAEEAASWHGSARLEAFAAGEAGLSALELGLSTETRLVLESRPGEGLSFRAEGGLREDFGAASKAAAAFEAGLAPLPAEVDIPPGSSLRRSFFVDQAFLRASLGRVDLAFGILPLSWGTGYVFNPSSRTGPAVFPGEDAEAATGAAGLDLTASLGGGLALEAYALASARRASPVPQIRELSPELFPFGVKLQLRSAALDTSVSLLRELASADSGALWFAAADAAFFAGPATLYAEAALALPGLGEGPPPGNWSAEAALEACAGLAYPLPFVDTTLRLELAWNGPGAASPEYYDLGAFLAGDRILLARRYAFAMLEKEDPEAARWKLSGGVLANLDDGSAALAAEASISPSLPLELSAFLRLFVSDAKGELGGERPIGGGLFFRPYRSAAGFSAKLSF